MSKFIRNTNGIMGLTFSQIGLFIASGILLIAVCSFIWSNNWQKTQDLRDITSSISSCLQDIDTRFYEDTALFQCPRRNYQYQVQISAESIVVSADGYWGNKIFVVGQTIVRPWVHPDDSNWTTKDDLHMFLNKTYGHQGTKGDPLSSANLSEIENEYLRTISVSSLHPFTVNPASPFFIEKVFLYGVLGEKFEFVVVYQPY